MRLGESDQTSVESISPVPLSLIQSWVDDRGALVETCRISRSVTLSNWSCLDISLIPVRTCPQVGADTTDSSIVGSIPSTIESCVVAGEDSPIPRVW